MSIVAEAKHVVKRYGTTIALDGVTLELKRGEIIGLLGPNGSGKSTLIKILMGFVPPDSGYVSVLGVNPYEYPDIRAKIGYVPEEVRLYESLTPKELFDLAARIRRTDADKYHRMLETLSNAFGLRSKLHNLIGSLSKGYRQKVAIVLALLHDPEILLLDEPIIGLDPVVAKVFKEILMELKRRGRAILFSTHILELAEVICDRIAIIHKGRIVLEGTRDEIVEQAKERGALEEAFLEVTGKRGEIEEIVKAIREEIV